MLEKYRNQIQAQLDAIRQRGLYRQRQILQGPQDRVVTIDGSKLINFCSNNYLGLANDERLREAFKKGVDRWGVGSGSADLVCGHTKAHQLLEEALAEFCGREQALLFANGYAANIGTINALLTSNNRIFEDRLNHASLLDGGWISRADFHWFAHKDYDDLEEQLKTQDTDIKRQMIVSDGVFSMDGDCCNLDRLVELSTKHQCLLMIDDAHGIGVLGKKGRGLVNPKHYSSHDVPVLMGTLGKAFGTAGAFVAGDRDLIELLIHKARNYIYSTAMPPAVAVAALESLRIAKHETWRRQHLQELIQQFRDGARALNLSLMHSETPIQPLVIGDAVRALTISERLQQEGLLVRAIRPPTVPKDTSRLRITFTASHTTDDVERLLNALEKITSEVTDDN